MSSSPTADNDVREQSTAQPVVSRFPSAANNLSCDAGHDGAILNAAPSSRRPALIVEQPTHKFSSSASIQSISACELSEWVITSLSCHIFCPKLLRERISSMRVFQHECAIKHQNNCFFSDSSPTTSNSVLFVEKNMTIMLSHG